MSKELAWAKLVDVHKEIAGEKEGNSRTYGEILRAKAFTFSWKSLTISSQRK